MRKKLLSSVLAFAVAIGGQAVIIAEDAAEHSAADKIEITRTELGIIVDAGAIAERFELDYEFDRGRGLFIMHDDKHGDIVLMDGAECFYSGDRVYECQPYFYVEDNIPKVEAGFFCEMFDSSCTIDEVTGELIISDTPPEVISVAEGGEETESLQLSETGTLSGKIYSADGNAFTDELINVGLVLTTRSTVREYLYGKPQFVVGDTYELGNIEINSGDIEKEFSFDTTGYYNESYPSYTLQYNIKSTYIYPWAYYNESNSFTKISDNPLNTNIKYSDSKELTTLADNYVDIPLEPIGSEDGDIKWSINLLTGELNIRGSGTLTSDMGYMEYKQFIKSVSAEGEFIIGSNAFANYTAMESFTADGSIKRIDDNAFSGNYRLESAAFPGLLCIGDGAFDTCMSLKNFELPDTLLEIGEYAFNGCEALEKIVIPEGITRIENYCFDGCKALKSVTLPQTVNKLGIYAFNGCSSITEITLPDSIKTIPAAAFYNCSSLKSINIPEDITKIDSYAFAGCGALSDFAMPPNIKEIGESAFKGSGISSLNIPKSVNIIGWTAFAETSRLSAVEFEEGFNADNMGNYIFQGSGVMSAVIPSSMTVLPYALFDGCTRLNKVSLPDTLKEIKAHAFQSCTYLRTVELPAGLEILGERAFAYSGIRKIVIPEGVKIGDDMFYYCKQLNDVTLPRNMTRINDYMFCNCQSLKTISLPEGITGIDNRAFYLCSELENIIIPPKVQYLSQFTFAGCPKLKTVYFSGNAPEINHGDYSIGDYPTFHGATPDIYYPAGNSTYNNMKTWLPDCSFYEWNPYEVYPTESPKPEITPEPTATAAPTSTPEPTATATPTSTPEPTATTAPTSTPEPTATAVPTATPKPDATDAPTASAEPAPTAQPHDYEVVRYMPDGTVILSQGRYVDGARLIVAEYKEDGALSGIHITEVPADTDGDGLVILYSGGIIENGNKIFVWQSGTNKPLAGVYIADESNN